MTAESEAEPESRERVVDEALTMLRREGTSLRYEKTSLRLEMTAPRGCPLGRKGAGRAALGPERETGACIDVAMALGYVAQVEPVLLHELDQVRAILAQVVM